MIVKRNAPIRNPAKYIQLNSETAKLLRKELYDEFQGVCPILKMEIPFDQAVLDHKHKRKTDPIGPNGDGLVRGFLDYRANALEGIFLKKFKKSGLYGVVPFETFLVNLAAYLCNIPCPQIYIYPSEKPKLPFLTKRDFDLITKWYKAVYPRRKKMPQYPPSGIKKKKVKVKGKKRIRRRYKARLTPKWEKMLKQAKEWKHAK